MAFTTSYNVDEWYAFAIVVNSPERQAQLAELTAHTRHESTIDISSKVFVYQSVTDEKSCSMRYRLQHVPPRTHFGGRIWYGGWYLPTCYDPSFDYAGRLIHSRTHALIASSYTGPDLPRVPYKWINEHTIRVFFRDIAYL